MKQPRVKEAVPKMGTRLSNIALAIGLKFVSTYFYDWLAYFIQ
jgi:hypothetical protein